jgi:hypothetical protein
VLVAWNRIYSHNACYMSVHLYIGVVCNPVECVAVSGLEVVDCYFQGCPTAVLSVNESSSGKMLSEKFRCMCFMQFHKNWIVNSGY